MPNAVASDADTVEDIVRGTVRQRQKLGLFNAAFEVDLSLPVAPVVALQRGAGQKQKERMIAVIMTGNPSVESNLRVLEAGGWDYLPKPFSATHLEVLIGRASHAVMAQREAAGASEGGAVVDTGSGELDVIGGAPSFRSALELARKVARSNASVFITGESGSGKELIAHYIHQNSRRANRRMVAVNCAALPESLIESELFGYLAGTYTGGAARGRTGLIEAADGGTLFLDEIGDMRGRGSSTSSIDPLPLALVRHCLDDGHQGRVSRTPNEARPQHDRLKPLRVCLTDQRLGLRFGRTIGVR